MNDAWRFLPKSTQRRLIPRSLHRAYGIAKELGALPRHVRPVRFDLRGGVVHLLDDRGLLCRRRWAASEVPADARLEWERRLIPRCPDCESEAAERWGC